MKLGMRQTQRVIVAALFSVLALLLSAGGGVQAASGTVFQQTINPLEVANQPLRGVTGGSLAWIISGGMATLDTSGKLTVEVKGLLFAPGTRFANRARPVTMVYAQLVSEDGTIVKTDAAPFDEAGNSHIEQNISLPAGFKNPIVMVMTAAPAGLANRWIAATPPITLPASITTTPTQWPNTGGGAASGQLLSLATILVGLLLAASGFGLSRVSRRPMPEKHKALHERS